MVYAFMADGCEEVEALAVIDLLRRAGEEVELVSIHNKDMTQGSHGSARDVPGSSVSPTII